MHHLFIYLRESLYFFFLFFFPFPFFLKVERRGGGWKKGIAGTQRGGLTCADASQGQPEVLSGLSAACFQHTAKYSAPTPLPFYNEDCNSQ